MKLHITASGPKDTSNPRKEVKTLLTQHFWRPNWLAAKIFHGRTVCKQFSLYSINTPLPTLSLS